MARILDHGTTHGAMPAEGGLAGLPIPHRFVTFQDVLGSVHTVLLDVDHELTDVREIVQAWEDGTLKTQATPREQIAAPASTAVVEGF